jgi:hypothetical protein
MGRTHREIEEVIQQVSYKNWRFIVGCDLGGRDYLQVSWQGEDVTSGIITEQKSRKWWLSPHMTNTELVTTAYKAVMAAEEHEVREYFRYKGAQVFNPHFDVDELVQFSKTVRLDSR